MICVVKRTHPYILESELDSHGNDLFDPSAMTKFRFLYPFGLFSRFKGDVFCRYQQIVENFVTFIID